MPSNVIHLHEEATEVSFTHDGQNQVVSLVPYLQRPDNAVAVIWEVQNDLTLAEQSRVSVKTGGEQIDLVHEGFLHHIDILSGVDKEVTILAADPKVHFNIAAELLSPGTVMHGSKIDVSPANGTEIDKWVNRTVTLEDGDSLGDVEVVLLSTRAYDLTAGGWEFGLRGLGSTTSKKWHHIYHSCNKFYPVKVVNGQYQIYVTGKDDPFGFDTYIWEFGYIKTGQGISGILNYVDEAPGDAAGWETRTASGVPSGSEGMFAVQDIVTDVVMQLWWHGARAMGSSDKKGIVDTVDRYDAADPVKLDAQRQYEYMAVSGISAPYNNELWILAYVWEDEIWPTPPAAIAEVIASGVTPSLEDMWLYPLVPSVIARVVANPIVPRLQEMNQCEWFDPVEGAWRSAASDAGFAASAAGNWRDFEGDQSFAVPSNAGWRSRKPCG